MDAINGKLVARFLNLKPLQVSANCWSMGDMPYWGVTAKTANECLELAYKHFRHDKDMKNLSVLIDKIESLGYVIKTLSTPTVSGRWFCYNIKIQTNSWKDIICADIRSDYENNETKVSSWFRGCIAFLEWYYANVEVVEEVI